MLVVALPKLASVAEKSEVSESICVCWLAAFAHKSMMLLFCVAAFANSVVTLPCSAEIFAEIAFEFAAVDCTVPSENFKLAWLTNVTLPESTVSVVCITADPTGVVWNEIRVPRSVAVKSSAASILIRTILPAKAPALVHPWLVSLSNVSLANVCNGVSTVPRAPRAAMAA